VPGHRENAKVLPFDPAKAKEMLAAAGYPDPSKMPALTLTFRDERPDIRRAAEAVATDIKTNLGVDVKLQAMEWGAYLDKLNKKEQVFFHMRWAADYLDPQNFLSHMLATNAPENKLGYSNPEFDRLTGLADREMDSAKRLPIYAQAEDIILDDAVWVPIYFQRDVELQSPRLSGLRESLFGHLPHTTTQLK
jgi:ABC-type oligopeptide transport system substrate-binding subunit